MRCFHPSPAPLLVVCPLAPSHGGRTPLLPLRRRWAYPDYAALRNERKVWNPTHLLPFVLCDGVEGGIFYANAVEQLAGAMEMAAIGGNVVANLTVQWCLRVVGQTWHKKDAAPPHAKAD